MTNKKQEVIEYIESNLQVITEDFIRINDKLTELLKTHPVEFHDIIKDNCKRERLSFLKKDLSHNLGIDYDTSSEILDDIELDQLIPVNNITSIGR